MTSSTHEYSVHIYSIWALVQCKAQTESQFDQLVQKIRPWLCKDITESEKHIKEHYQAILDHQKRDFNGRIDAVKRYLEDHLSSTQVLDFSTIRIETSQLYKEIRVAAIGPLTISISSLTQSRLYLFAEEPIIPISRNRQCIIDDNAHAILGRTQRMEISSFMPLDGILFLMR